MAKTHDVTSLAKKSISALASPTAYNLLVVFALLMYFGVDAYLKETRNMVIGEYLRKVEDNRHSEIDKMRELLNTCMATTRN